MYRLARTFTVWIVMTMAIGFGQSARAAVASPGFLVIAPDRGYLGNEEIKTAWAEFDSTHLTRLVFISLSEDYQRDVRARLEGAVAEMQREGATNIVLIPFVVSEADPHLKKAREILANAKIRIAPVFGGSPLARQILEDRVRALSKEPSKERLVVISFGATSREEAGVMTRDLERLAAEVQKTLHLADTSIAVFYAGQAPDAVRDLGNTLAETTIVSAMKKTDLRTLVVPFHLGYKHTGSMRLGQKIESLLGSGAGAYDGRELLPDPLVSRWLRKTASQYLPLHREEVGIVVMAHGAGEYYNARILAAIEPLRQKYNIEVAFGMADDDILQATIDKIEARSARRIHILRLYDLPQSFQAETEFVLGLRSAMGAISHSHNEKSGPSRIRSGAILSTSGGFGDHPLIAEILLQRTLEVSQAPDRETVILLAHGAGNDEDERFWIEQLKKRAEFIRMKAPAKFKAIKVATVREDWPEKSERAVAEVRKMIEEASRENGRVLVISNRIAGAGPYRRLLSGLDYTLNDQGIASHPHFTRWIEEQIENWLDATGRQSTPMAR